jgi:large subunit ribosomal protein L29
MTKTKELRNLSNEELLLKQKTIKDELFKLDYQRRFGRLEKPHMFKLLKRDIARINTLLKEKK